MGAIYEKWWHAIRNGAPLPKAHDIPAAETTTLTAIRSRLACRQGETDLPLILDRAYQELGRTAIAYQIATNPDHAFQADYLVPLYIESIAELKAAITHVQGLIQERQPLFPDKEDT